MKEQVQRIINNEILTLANELNSFLQESPGSIDHWYNLYLEESNEYVEIYQYFIVTPWLAEKLHEIGEPVAIDYLGLNFWGRTCCGQAIELDGTIQKIVEKIYKKENR